MLPQCLSRSILKNIKPASGLLLRGELAPVDVFHNGSALSLFKTQQRYKEALRLKESDVCVSGQYSESRLDFIIKNINEITAGPPKTFSAALQLVWLCHTAFMTEGRYAMVLNRMDQYLYPFYRHDIQSGGR